MATTGRKPKRKLPGTSPGKYQEQHRCPRPILIRFNRAIDVFLLLPKTSSLPHGIRIKPDMTREERLIESILLKERLALIQRERAKQIKSVETRYL